MKTANGTVAKTAARGDKKKIALPVTEGLKVSARAAADRDGRSLANFCRQAIQRALPDE